MAKKVTAVVLGQVTFVHFGQLAPSHDIVNRVVRRVRRTDPERAELCNMLARNGWLPGLGIIAAFDNRSPLWKLDSRYQELLDSTYAERVKTFDMKVKQGDADLPLWKAAYCDEAGKVIRPSIVPNTCNGRLDELYKAYCLRATGFVSPPSAEDKDEGRNKGEDIPAQEVSWYLPVQMKSYLDEGNRIEDQIDENSKEAGYVEPDAVDKLNTMVYLIQECGWSQGRVRTKYPGTTGQRAGLLIELAQLWSPALHKDYHHKSEVIGSRPDLDIIRRLTDRSLRKGKKAADVWINLKGINDIPGLTLIRDRSTPIGLAKRNAKIEADNQSIRDNPGTGNLQPLLLPATPEEVEKFLREGKASNVKKSLTREAWEGIKKQPNKIAQAVADAHLSGDMGSMALITNNALVLNEVYRFLEQGRGQDVLDSLQCVTHSTFRAYADAVKGGYDIALTVSNPDEEGQEDSSPPAQPDIPVE